MSFKSKDHSGVHFYQKRNLRLQWPLSQLNWTEKGWQSIGWSSVVRYSQVYLKLTKSDYATFTSFQKLPLILRNFNLSSVKAKQRTVIQSNCNTYPCPLFYRALAMYLSISAESLQRDGNSRMLLLWWVPKRAGRDLERCDGTTGTYMTNINCTDGAVGPLTWLLHLYFWLLLSYRMHLHTQCTVGAERVRKRTCYDPP